MAAALTVPQASSSLNPSSPFETLTPTRGVLTLFGYGIRVHVDRGHLLVEDGIGTPRRRARFARVGHDLRRLVIIGADGVVSLAALRWLADQDAAFVMLDRNGSVLATTGPVRRVDARLRRSQALAHHTGVAVPIIRRLIDHKLAGQERLARGGLNNIEVAETIAAQRERIRQADTPEAIRSLEAHAAQAYWAAWSALPVQFPRADVARVPAHWQTFGARRSPLSGSPRLAVNPANAMLNYLYALLESEASFAAVAVGLDPGIGLLHVDTDARDSFACDLMESVRPQCDAYVFECLTRGPLRREWFFEERSGNCRLMGSFVTQLSETTPTWARAVSPVAKWVADMLWSTVRKPARPSRVGPRRAPQRGHAPQQSVSATVEQPPTLPNICLGCGAVLRRDSKRCVKCERVETTARLIQAAEYGRVLAQTPKAQSKRAKTQRRNALAQHAWRTSDQPEWLTEQFYSEQIRPKLTTVTVSTLAKMLGVSYPYAVNIRAGRRRPHPRHWLTLARLLQMLPT